MLGDGIGSSIRKSKLINRRMFIASTAKAVVFFGIISRLFYLQVEQNKKYLTLSDKNRIRENKLPPIRGEFKDYFGKTIAASLNKPFIAVNHLEGHAISPKFNSELNFPYLLLLISGGHTQYLLVEGLGNYKRLGTTIDDALGEAFDKTAKIIGIEFPGGPKIEKYAERGNKERFKLPKPILNRGGCNLSFAGLKTAILRIQPKIKNQTDRFDLAASFQKTIEEILVEKTKVAFQMYLNE